LLLLYEFEAKARLGDPDAERVLDRAMCLPQTEPKLFEAIAGKSVYYLCTAQVLKCFVNEHVATLTLLCSSVSVLLCVDFLSGYVFCVWDCKIE